MSNHVCNQMPIRYEGETSEQCGCPQANLLTNVAAGIIQLYDGCPVGRGHPNLVHTVVIEYGYQDLA